MIAAKPIFRKSVFQSLLACALLGFGPGGKAADFYVAGAGDVPLSVTEVGPRQGAEILFIHGIGQGRASFNPQLDSVLATQFHMVAFDLRGHGASGKPWDETAYTSPAVWAEDVARVMAATGLHRPVVVAWSYGSGVAADIIRVNGAATMSGLVLVSALGGFVASPPPTGTVPPELIRARDLQRSARVEDLWEGSRLVMGFMTAGHAPPGWIEMATALGASVPAYAQDPLRKHPAKNQDLLGKLDLPVLVVHGGQDTSFSDSAGEGFARQVKGAKSVRFDAAGHSPFAEDPERFNALLKTFVVENWALSGKRK